MERNINTNNNENNNEIEIDLVELFGVFKKNAKLILGTTAAFAAAAAIYSFMIAKPVYQHDVLFRIPADVNNVQINTCNEILKNKIGVEEGLSGVALMKSSSVIKLSFNGSSPEIVADDVEKSLPRLAEQVNKAFTEEAQRRFSNYTATIIRNEISAISIKLSEKETSLGEVEDRLKKLAEKISFLEENHIFPKVEVIKEDKVSNIPALPNKKRNIAIAAVLGLFLSGCYVAGKFLIGKSR